MLEITSADLEQAMTDAKRDEVPYPKRRGVWFGRVVTASGAGSTSPGSTTLEVTV